MADIISLQELADAKLDAQSLEQFINGGVDEEVLTRLSQQYPTIKKLLLEFQKYNGRAYKTYAEMDADKANLSPKTKVTVTNDATASNNGDWQWDGAVFTKSAFDLMAQVNANAMFKPKTYAVGVDFNTLTTYGCHTFLNGTAWSDSTNRPEQTAQWGHVLVFPTTANVITQVAIMGNVTKTFAMRLRTDTGVWQAWGYFHSFDKIVELLKADIINVLSAQRSSSTINQLNPVKVLTNYEVRSDGTLSNTAKAVSSDLIYCFNKDSIYVSGLQANNAATRYYRFLNQNGVLISGGGIASGSNEGLITVPPNAYSFQITLKSSNNLNALDVSIAQVEFGATKTPYIGYDYGAISHINGIALADTQFSLNSAAAGKNLFDKSTVLVGFEVYSDGRVLAQITSISSAPINVSGLSNITISGLVQNPEIVRYGVFKDSSGAVLSVIEIPKTSTFLTIAVPTNAKTFQFSIKQRSTATPDLNIVQVESGTNATAYEEYKRGFSELNGVPVVAQSTSSQAAQTSRAYGAKYLMFGDSITQTGDVDNGDFTSTTFRSNWPKFAKDMLKMSEYKNYAKSGASFREYTGQLTWQKISHQVQTAIDNSENPDVIVLACGTNDANTILGSYETAMSKNIADLDRTYTAEAMRWALYKIKENFPNAVCFYCTQLQRADVETTDRETANDLMVKLAKRYGFNIINCMNESGIVKDFEVWQAAGRYLSDGLHPNVSGQQVQSNLIVSQIIERMTY
ncbi:SGNH/GDSL hydrolase family protein [Acinetobacter johnsonii]|uniref:GDSL-type esterase/lipase family protein n=1 Tax=Acinetobacter johnsonii TaxID=40214 RepID=UPI003D1728EE